MKTNVVTTLVACGLYTVSAVTGRVPDPEATSGDRNTTPAWQEMLRAAARPLALPSIWARLDEASRSGDAHRALAASRALAGLWPEWTDASVHVAWVLAYDLLPQASDPDAALDLLLRAVDELERRGEQRRADGDDDHAAQLWFAAAVLLEDRCRQVDGLGSAFRDRLGRAPVEAAAELVAAAARLFPDDEVHRTRLAFVTLRTITSALQAGDLERAERSRRTALRQMESLASLRDDAREAAAALGRLGDLHALVAEPRRLDRLAADPWLADVVEALRELPHRGGR